MSVDWVTFEIFLNSTNIIFTAKRASQYFGGQKKELYC